MWASRFTGVIFFILLSLVVNGCQDDSRGTGTPNPGLSTDNESQLPPTDHLQSKIILAASDTNTKSSYPNQVKGASLKVDVWNTEFEEKIGYIKYDLKDISASAQIKRAYIRFYFYNIRLGGVLNFYSVQGDWNEATLTHNTSLNLQLNFEISFYFSKDLEGTYVDVDVTDLVRQWVSGSLINDGIAIAGSPDGSPVQIDFFSKEEKNSPNQLFVEYLD